MARTYENEFHFDFGGYEALIKATYHITPYDPGVLSGPAENCYPPEGGEVEIIALTIDGLDATDRYANDSRIIEAIFEAHAWDDKTDWDDIRDRDRDYALVFGPWE